MVVGVRDRDRKMGGIRSCRGRGCVPGIGNSLAALQRWLPESEIGRFLIALSHSWSSPLHFTSYTLCGALMLTTSALGSVLFCSVGFGGIYRETKCVVLFKSSNTKPLSLSLSLSVTFYNNVFFSVVLFHVDVDPIFSPFLFPINFSSHFQFCSVSAFLHIHSQLFNSHIFTKLTSFFSKDIFFNVKIICFFNFIIIINLRF